MGKIGLFDRSNRFLVGQRRQPHETRHVNVKQRTDEERARVLAAGVGDGRLVRMGDELKGGLERDAEGDRDAVVHLVGDAAPLAWPPLVFARTLLLRSVMPGFTLIRLVENPIVSLDRWGNCPL